MPPGDFWLVIELSVTALPGAGHCGCAQDSIQLGRQLFDLTLDVIVFQRHPQLPGLDILNIVGLLVVQSLIALDCLLCVK